MPASSRSPINEDSLKPLYILSFIDEVNWKSSVDLSEMNMTLLKKVEELTLYVIEQNKKIESLEKKVNEK